MQTTTSTQAAEVVHGHVAPGFEGVRDTLAASLADLGQGGCALAAYHRGELVVDLWAGQAGDTPWERDTTSLFMSTTKPMTALCVQLLHDRGALDVTAPVAQYWPEFAQAGKASVTLTHVLTHTSGVLGSPRFTELSQLSGEGLTRADEVADALAAAEPLWEPGSQAGYQTTTFGWILGEVIRRVDGRDLGAFFRDEVAAPLGCDDLGIGVPAEQHARIAPLQPLIVPEGMPEELRAYTEWFLAEARNPDSPSGISWGATAEGSLVDHLPEAFNTAPWRTIPMGSSNMIGTARSAARVFAAVADPDGIGVRLGAEESTREFTRLHESRPDVILGLPIARGLGWNLNQPLIPRPPSMGPNPETCGHGGIGGQMGYADPVARLGVAFTRSHYTMLPLLNLMLNAALYAGVAAADAQA